MILVDSSALIEYYRPSGRTEVRRAVAEGIAADRLAVNGIIQVEILGFAAGEKEQRLLRSDFEAFHHLDLHREVCDLAASLGFELRRQGVTVPATDLIIAANALQAEVPVYHLDGHFERIAQNSNLDHRYLG